MDIPGNLRPGFCQICFTDVVNVKEILAFVTSFSDWSGAWGMIKKMHDSNWM